MLHVNIVSDFCIEPKAPTFYQYKSILEKNSRIYKRFRVISFILDGTVRLVSVNNVLSNKPTIRILCLYN